MRKYPIHTRFSRHSRFILSPFRKTVHKIGCLNAYDVKFYIFLLVPFLLGQRIFFAQLVKLL